MLSAPLETFPEGTGYPEQGVHAKECECADQQPGHGPEGVEQIRVFVPIMMGGVGQVTRKLPIGTRMAGSTGFHDIIPVQSRSGIIGRQDVMGAVTV